MAQQHVISGKQSLIRKHEMTNNSRKKITIVEIQKIYPIAMEVYKNGTGKSKERDILIKNTGMNTGSAGDYIRVFQKMMNGEEYNRTINQEATRYYFKNILKDFNKEALKNALNATKLHFEYYATKGKGELKSIRAIHKEFSAKL